MSAIRFRDRNGQVKEVPYLKGDPGDTPQVDQELSDSSTNAIANRVVTAIFNELADIRVGADDNTYDTAGDAVRYQFVEIKQAVVNAGSAASELYRRLTLEVEPAVAENTKKIGDVETALDGIIAIQESLIGGVSV